MCGIVGYAGNIETACGKPLEVCLQGLERLEYRGYDSAGVALTAPGMWFQLFTTNEPDDSMIEVGIAAVQAVLPEKEGSDRW